jgi:AAA+ ATPase superfamily predicted ATPase
MDTFVGRAPELAQLMRMREEIGRTQRGAFVSVRGRRRIGKSRLIEEFARRSGSPYAYYVATHQDPEVELTRFRDALAGSALQAGDLVRDTTFGTWEAGLSIVATGATWDRPAIVVIDEFPYLVEREPAIESIVQTVWDRTLQRQPVMLVLIGSDVATMEALSEHGRPLYDRPRELVVHPLTPADVAEMLALGPADAFDAYATIGGFPELAIAWGRGRTRTAFLTEALQDPTSPLIVSAERALRAELPTQAHARTVLSTIGAGERAFTALQSRTHLPRATLDLALRLLAGRRVVARQLPYSARSGSKLTRWSIADPYLRFWLRFVEPNVELVERGRGALALELVNRGWNAYRGQAVEPLVRASIERLLPDERFGGARFVGGYWTRDNRVEVDLVGGATPAAPEALDFVGSIKWRDDAPFDRSDAVALAAAQARVPGADERTRLVGVSRGGFEQADALDATLSADDLLDAWRRPADQ